MTARVLDGNAVAQSVKWDLASRVRKLAEHGIIPGLGALLVGNDPASRSYVRGKPRSCYTQKPPEIRGFSPLRRGLPLPRR